MAELPDEWTDDMTIPLPPGRTDEEVVKFVLQAALRGTPNDETEKLLAPEFHLSSDDAALARDRSLGGLVLGRHRQRRELSAPAERPLGVGSLRVGVAEHDSRRWDRSGSWAVESRDAALARAPEFGRRFFQAVIAEFAEAAEAHFLRWSEQPGDMYTVFDLPGGGAGVQIDPDLKYIIVWGADGQAEYGNWGADQVPPAVAHLRRLISGGRAGPGAAKAVGCANHCAA